MIRCSFVEVHLEEEMFVEFGDVNSIEDVGDESVQQEGPLGKGLVQAEVKHKVEKDALVAVVGNPTNVGRNDAQPLTWDVVNLGESEPRESLAIGLASDDVRKLINAWQRGKLVLNKGSAHTKACWEKSLSLGEALYFFVEKSERFWQLLHCLVHHISKMVGIGQVRGRFLVDRRSPSMLLYGTLSLLRTNFAGCYAGWGLWRSTCKPYSTERAWRPFNFPWYRKPEREH